MDWRALCADLFLREQRSLCTTQLTNGSGSYRYHIELNRLSGNQFLEFFYKRPYIRFYTTLLADLAPGGHWDQYVLNYRLINDMILSGDAHSSVVSFVSHIRWVLRNMRVDNSV